MTKRPQSPVIIPRSELAADLAEAERIKREMTALLQELEHQAAGDAQGKPGGWRHDPQGWAKRLES